MSARVRHNPLESARVGHSPTESTNVRDFVQIFVQICTNIFTKSQTLVDSAGLWLTLADSSGLWWTLADIGGSVREMSVECPRDVRGMFPRCQRDVPLCPPRRTHEVCPLQFARGPLQFASVRWRTLAELKSPPDSSRLGRTQKISGGLRQTEACGSLTY